VAPQSRAQSVGVLLEHFYQFILLFRGQMRPVPSEQPLKGLEIVVLTCLVESLDYFWS
jgi:hypothetical protein